MDKCCYTTIPATMDHADQIHELITYYAERNRMLFRSFERLYEHVRDFRVCVIDENGVDKVIGCGALEVLWRDLAEIKSLAVHWDHKRQGIGKALIFNAIEEARALKLTRVFALTYEVDFFKALGFVQVSKASLPHKVWKDCIHCPSQDNCLEVPVVMDLDQTSSVA